MAAAIVGMRTVGAVVGRGTDATVRLALKCVGENVVRIMAGLAGDLSIKTAGFSVAAPTRTASLAVPALSWVPALI